MWTLRILTGSQAGQNFPLPDGKSKVGRSSTCQLVINANGISKEHVEFHLMGDKIVFTDLNSSNGTYLNGVRTKSGMVKAGDKIGIHNIIVDVVFAVKKTKPSASAEKKNSSPSPLRPQPLSPMPVQFQQQSGGEFNYPVPSQGNAPGQYSPQPGGPVPLMQMAPPPRDKTVKEKFDDYVNSVVLQPFYTLIEQIEFKLVILGFVGLYVLIVTMLSVIPMNQITNESIQREAERRAKTVARALAQANERVIRNGDLASFSTDFAMKEDGVDDVYIVSREGRIIAPADRLGTVPKDIGFYKEYIKVTSAVYTAVLGTQVGAAFPITSFDQDTQKNVARAYAVVIYNPGSLTFGDGRVLSLFIQTLAIAIIIGMILFFFINRLIEYPYRNLNISLDEAIRESKDSITSKIQLPAMQNMMININTLLTRIVNPASNQNGPQAGAGSKNNEYLNVLSLIGFPALLINQDGLVLKVNASFEPVTHMTPAQVENQRVNMIPDQAMQKNFAELMTAAAAQTGEIIADKLEIGGVNYKLSCQAMTTASGEVDCYFITISPLEGSEGQAA